MIPRLFVDIAVVPALSMLPARMNSKEARAMLVAIALQESRITEREQIGGPARSYFQMERGGGVTGVLSHPSSRSLAMDICTRLDIMPMTQPVYAAITYNDVLAAAFARLLLWTSPLQIPKEHEAFAGWQMYQSTWRPGKPHPDRWNGNFDQAWAVVNETEAV